MTDKERIKQLEKKVAELERESREWRQFVRVDPLIVKKPCDHPAHKTTYIGHPNCPICYPPKTYGPQ